MTGRKDKKIMPETKVVQAENPSAFKMRTKTKIREQLLDWYSYYEQSDKTNVTHTLWIKNKIHALEWVLGIRDKIN
jgi:hypothetical protein